MLSSTTAHHLQAQLCCNIATLHAHQWPSFGHCNQISCTPLHARDFSQLQRQCWATMLVMKLEDAHVTRQRTETPLHTIFNLQPEQTQGASTDQLHSTASLFSCQTTISAALVAVPNNCCCLLASRPSWLNSAAPAQSRSTIFHERDKQIQVQAVYYNKHTMQVMRHALHPALLAQAAEASLPHIALFQIC
jgi:hypothetical protein